MTTLHLPPADPARCRAELAAAATPYEKAVAWGRCRCFGVDPGNPLSRDEAVQAALVLRNHLEDWTMDARALGDRFDAAPRGYTDLPAIRLFDARSECWAAYLAIDTAYQDALDRKELQPEQVAAFHHLGELQDRFDNALHDRVDLLSLVANSDRLEKWRGWLAGEFRELPPWWLDGTLEEAAERAEREFRRPLPWTRPKRIRVLVIPSSRPSVALAADDEPEPVAAVRDAFTWQAPAGGYQAFLTVREPPKSPLILAILKADDTPASDLEGVEVRLAGAPAKLNASGHAHFEVSSFPPDTALEPTLTVGGTTWKLREEEA